MALAAFAAGVCVLQTREALLPGAGVVAWMALGVLLVAGVCSLHDGRRAGVALGSGATSRTAARRAGPLTLLVAASAAVLGFACASWRAELRMAAALAPAYEGATVVLTGIVDDLPAVTERGTRFAFAVEHAEPAAAHVPARVSLAWFPADRDDDEEEGAVPPLRPGERWQLRARLKRPHGNVNPGGFDLEAWLLQHDLRATGYVVAHPGNRLLDDFAARPRDVVQRTREAIRTRLARDLGSAPHAGTIIALAIGDQRAIPDAQWTVFNRTGIGHLVSISGLHVTVFASLAGALAAGLARCCVRLTSRIPARRIAVLVGMTCAGLYTLLAGAEIPAVRTFAMLAVAAWGVWLARPGTAGVVWLWALAAVLAWDPWAPLTPGFWLSYGAVAVLLYAGTGRLHEESAVGVRRRALHNLREGAHAQWIVTVGLTPLTLLLFGQTSLVAPLANAVAIPVVTLAVVPAALLAILVPLAWLPQVAHAVLVPLMTYLEWLAAWPDATWRQHVPPAWCVTVAMIGVLWLVAPRGVPGRALGLAWLLPLFLVRPLPPPEGAWRLTVLDVGQGLAAVVQTHRRVLVYDTGPGFGDVADAGGRIVAPFLRARGLGYVDAIVVSHQDLDHAGGALSLMNAVPFGSLLSSLPHAHPVAQLAAASHDTLQCRAGHAWTWDGVRFTLLHPTHDEYEHARTRTNDRSCVLRIDGAGGSALLPGDVEAISEARLLRKLPGALRADVLVAPHHGSRTSSTAPFVRAVAPAYAVMTAGYLNRFGHPKSDVVARYTGHGAQVVRTDLAGALAFEFVPGQPIAVTGERGRRARYWHEATAVP